MISIGPGKLITQLWPLVALIFDQEFPDHQTALPAFVRGRLVKYDCRLVATGSGAIELQQWNHDLLKVAGDGRRFDTILTPLEFPQWKTLFEPRVRQAMQQLKGDIETKSWKQ